MLYKPRDAAVCTLAVVMALYGIGCQKQAQTPPSNALGCTDSASCGTPTTTGSTTQTSAGGGTEPTASSGGSTTTSGSGAEGGTPVSRLGFERFQYQTRSVKRLVCGLDLSSLATVDVNLNNVDYPLAVVSPFHMGFSSLKEFAQALDFADQETIGQLLQYGSHKVNLTLSVGGEEERATDLITLSDFSLFATTTEDNFSATDPNTNEVTFEGWVNSLGYPDATGGGRTYAGNLLLLTGFYPIVNY